MLMFLRVTTEVVTGVALGAYLLTTLVQLATLARAVVAVLTGRWSAFGPSAPAKSWRFMMVAMGPQRVQQVRAALETIQDAMGWPVRSAMGRWAARRPNGARLLRAMRQLWPPDGWYAVFSAVLLGAVTLLAVADLIWPPLALTLVVLVIAGTAGRHLSYLLGGLAGRLRSSLLPPLPTLAAIAAGDALALALASSLLLAPHGGTHIGLGGLRAGVLDLLAFKKLTWFNDPPDTVRQLIVATVGLLFYTSVAKTLLNPGVYARSGSDFSNVAWSLAITGDAKRAREWSLRDKEGGQWSLQARVAVELADGRFPEALRITVTRQRAKGEDASVDSCVLWLFAIASMVTLWADSTAPVAFLRDCLAAGAADTAVVTCMGNALNGELVQPTALEALLPLVPEERYPLSRGLIVARTSDIATARAILENATPGTEIEEVLRLVAFLELGMAESPTDEELGDRVPAVGYREAAAHPRRAGEHAPALEKDSRVPPDHDRSDAGRHR